MKFLCFQVDGDMRQTLIAESNLPNACDVFVLSEGAHRYRDALALAELLRNLGPKRNVRIWPVLSPREGWGDRQRGNLAAEQRLRLIQPKSTDRTAIVIGRAELFGPDIDLYLLPRLRPARPVRMADEPSAEQTYREMTLEGRLRRKPRSLRKADRRLCMIAPRFIQDGSRLEPSGGASSYWRESRHWERLVP